MSKLFGWQLAGDVVKMASWVLGYVLIGRAATTAFIVSEIIFSGTLVLLTIIFTESIGVAGVSKAHFINYVAYFLVMLMLVRRMVSRGI